MIVTPQHIISIDNRILVADIIKRLAQGQMAMMTVRGRSMRPFIEDGRDRVVIASCDDYRVGDVVLADTAEKGYVIHRLTLIDPERDYCELRGDGNMDVEHCTIDDLKGKIVMLYRKVSQKPCSLDSRRWKIYSWWWTRLLPIRGYLLAIHRRLFL